MRFLPAILVCIVGCSAGYLPGTGPGGDAGDGGSGDDGSSDGGGGCSSGVDHASCYPTTDIGSKATQRIDNFDFVGYPSDASGLPLDTSKGAKTVRLGDYYDPASTKYDLLVIAGLARWSSPDQQLAAEIVQQAPSLGKQKVVFIAVLTDGADTKPATLTELNAFIAEQSLNVTGVIDPGAAKLKNLYNRAATPLFVVVDPRSMEIRSADVGAPTDLVALINQQLQWVHTHPPKG